jgi:ubiquinone/menaquinone biosynthesis C-methylase UbiE
MDFLKLRRPLRSLESIDPSLYGIFSPGYPREDVDRHIHALFNENYEEYMRPFPLTRGVIDHWKTLIQGALPASHADCDAHRIILDIGSGEGTSVFPMIELLPNANIIASDLSTNLLRELRHWHEAHYPDHRRLWLLQLNAEDTVFEDNQIDLLTGAHVLHHLSNLNGTFREIHRILRPGGCAIFWDVFESGLQVLSLVMQILIAANEGSPDVSRIPSEILGGFRLFMADLHRRKGSYKSPALLANLDDKWVFTRTQLERALDGSGLELNAIQQVYSPDGLIARMMDHELRRQMQSLDRLPDWAKASVHEIDQQFSSELKEETLFSGAVILSKPGLS